MVPRHAQDVGQILVEAQAELRSIRDSLAEDGGRGPSADKLQAVVEKVEAELKLKAEAVLSTAQHSTPSTLPSLGSFNFRAPPGGTIGEPSADAASMHGTARSLPRPRLQLPPRSSSADHKSTRVGAKFAAAQRFEMALTNPNAARSRAYLTERFGIKQPSRKSLPRAAGKRPANPSRPLKAQTVGSLGTLDGATRRDPHARPPIAPSDVAAGLYSLVNRGLLPPHIDLTGAMCRQPAPAHPLRRQPRRLKGISYDLLERSGTVFNLMDSFASGVLGIVTIGKSPLDSLRKFADTLDFIQKQARLACVAYSNRPNAFSLGVGRVVRR